MRLISGLARGFNVDAWWKLYDKSTKCEGILKQLYIFRYMRSASKDGGYCGRTAILKGKPIMPMVFMVCIFQGMLLSVEMPRYFKMLQSPMLQLAITVSSARMLCLLGQSQ